jgi:1-acyl-sn-glycerol-3-phosphate acyltransferase
MTKRILGFLIRIVLSLIADIELIGYENIPESGFILATNHVGRLDSAMIFYIFNRQDIILPIAEKYEHDPIFGPLGRGVGGIWLDRSNPDIHAIRAIIRRLKAGGILFIAPEGTRSKTGGLQRGKPGVSFLANKAGVPIVTAALTGTEDRVVLDNLKHFRRLHIVGKAGEPFHLPPMAGMPHDEALQMETDEIMCRIAALLPEKYRGVYADNPRLKELLKEEYA